MPGGLGHADLANKLVPTLVPRQLLGGARVGRCHGLLEELALAFAMGKHWHGRLGSGAGQGCLYSEMPAELVKNVVEGGRVGGGRGAPDGGAADEVGGVRDFSGVRICLPFTWGC